LGFRINDKTLKRAGMDYWDRTDVRYYDDYEDFVDKNPGVKLYMATTKAKRNHTEVSYDKDAYIMFGKESAGIPEEILKNYQDTSIRIPMWGEIRSLNLSNAVAIVLYEALRQNDFMGLKMHGKPRTFDWD
jgi:tRNA (cytidine/uridine-2'-O-)-methyltransferase